MRTRLSIVLMLVAALSVSATAQKPSKSKKKDKAAALPAVIWRDPGDAASLNLLYGAGGKEHAPNPEGTFTFEREDLAETSPKFDVEDDQRVQWRVKLGAEPQSETSATRLLCGERQYAVSDAGATFGNTGNNFTRSKSVPKDYAASKFVEKAAPDFVDFLLHSRPFLLGAVDVNNYRDRTKMEQVTKHIPRADAVWLGQRLSMLSEEQIRDAFRAAGYAPAEIEILTQTVRNRIADLAAL